MNEEVEPDIGSQQSSTLLGSPDIPSENGRRRSIAPNGEVRGSGVGAGGGNPGEDFDTDEHGGDGAGSTGVGPGFKRTPAQGAGDRE